MRDYSIFTTDQLNTLRAAHSVDDSYSSSCAVRAIDAELESRTETQEGSNMTTSFADYQAEQQAAADAWLEANADALYESRNGEGIEIYGEEYFNLEALENDNFDDLDYYGKMGYYIAPRRGRVEMRPWNGDNAPAVDPVGYSEGVHGKMATVSPDAMAPAAPKIRAGAEMAPFAGVPVVVYGRPRGQAKSLAGLVKAQRAKAAKRTSRMDRLRAKADRLAAK